MKDRIIEVLKSHEPKHHECHTPIGCYVDYREYMLVAYEIDQLINQEVEKRIAERMPSDEEIGRAFTSEHYHWEKGRYYKVRKDRIFGAKWLRSRLTNQKTEGGENG